MSDEYTPDAYAPGPQGKDEPGCFPKAATLVIVMVLIWLVCL